MQCREPPQAAGLRGRQWERSCQDHRRHPRFLKDGDLKDDRSARLSASHTKLVMERGGERTRNQSH